MHLPNYYNHEIWQREFFESNAIFIFSWKEGNAILYLSLTELSVMLKFSFLSFLRSLIIFCSVLGHFAKLADQHFQHKRKVQEDLATDEKRAVSPSSVARSSVARHFGAKLIFIRKVNFSKPILLNMARCVHNMTYLIKNSSIVERFLNSFNFL